MSSLWLKYIIYIYIYNNTIYIYTYILLYLVIYYYYIYIYIHIILFIYGLLAVERSCVRSTLLVVHSNVTITSSTVTLLLRCIWVPCSDFIVAVIVTSPCSAPPKRLGQEVCDMCPAWDPPDGISCSSGVLWKHAVVLCVRYSVA